MYYSYCYNYGYSKRKSIFMLILFILLFLFIFESPLHSLISSTCDEFCGDEDDCDK